MIRTYSILTALGFLTLTNAAFSAIVINMEQVGNDVVATASGTADITTLQGPGSGSVVGAIWGSRPMVSIGPAGDTDYISYGPVSGPTEINSLGFISADSGSGQRVGVFYEDSLDLMGIFLPVGYVSGTSISSSSTWINTTLGDLGLTEGDIFGWTWGSSGTGERLTLQVVPEPSIYAAALGAAAIGLTLLRRRKSQPKRDEIRS